MANKVLALLAVCLVFFAAVQIPHVSADLYGKCFVECEKACKGEGKGQTFCEMKCDSDCFQKDLAARRLHLTKRA